MSFAVPQGVRRDANSKKTDLIKMSDPDAHRRKVLLLEDEALILIDVEMMLLGAGFEVRGVRTPTEALSLLTAEAFDVGVLDAAMPRGNSFDVADEMARRQVPFMFCTGDPTGIPATYANVPILGKPFREDELLDAIRRLLGKVAS